MYFPHPEIKDAPKVIMNYMVKKFDEKFIKGDTLTRVRYVTNLKNGSYAIKIFCSEFTRIYDLEVDYDELSSDENHEFGKLC